MFRDLPYRSFEEQRDDCAAWLALFARPGGAGRPMCSYAAKHLVQAWCGRYVSSTAVVEAARLAGFRVSEPTSSGNAWITKRARAETAAELSRA
jgi:hypothetical protein